MRLNVSIILCLMALLAACVPTHTVQPVVAVKPPVTAAVEQKAAVEVTPKEETVMATLAVAEIAPVVVPKNSLKRLHKKDFMKLMKPYIQRENKRVMREKGRLMAWKSQPHLTTLQRTALQAMAKTYRLKLQGEPDARFWSRLFKRVDIIPVEMVLAQAANESAWGNSRFAREANNYFGQWCFRKGCGLVPLKRRAGAHHEVKHFASPQLSVRAYINNLNSLPAYRVFRDLRLSQRRAHKPLDAYFLAMGLKAYSERGMAYVKNIRSLIRSNRKIVRSL
ncbi:MAG: glucosaminidase domain-containing protein [Mariprofundus sp.]|nr:glucosaminidase domain-containing protein [Mariprofundus sp.]